MQEKNGVRAHGLRVQRSGLGTKTITVPEHGWTQPTPIGWFTPVTGHGDAVCAKV